MPAALEDPTQPPHYRPDIMVPEITPLTILLKDGETTATIYPISPSEQLPIGLLAFLCDEFNMEIERGDTYPLFDTLHIDTFQNYWFGSFAGVMLLGDSPTIQQTRQWEKECLGTFYVKPNYPGRCSHICTAGFLVNAGIRGKGIGRTLAECYLDWAPKLGYSYSVFNLVFETNIAARRIWEALNFKRIGRVKEAGILKGHESAVDAIIYGRDLGDAQEDFIEMRFDKIKYYLETGRYPPQSDRQEKSRLRSSAAHYKLLDGKLMLKDREVISDPVRQLQIATEIHHLNHAGINKTTSQIAERYHWTRIKETVGMAIRNCAECRETTRPPPKRVRREQSHNQQTQHLQQPQQSQQQPQQPPSQQQQQSQPQSQPQQQQQQQHGPSEAPGPTDSIMMDIPTVAVGPSGHTHTPHTHHHGLVTASSSSSSNAAVALASSSLMNTTHHHIQRNAMHNHPTPSDQGSSSGFVHTVHHEMDPQAQRHISQQRQQQQQSINQAINPDLVSVSQTTQMTQNHPLHHLSGLASQVQQQQQQAQQTQDLLSRSQPQQSQPQQQPQHHHEYDGFRHMEPGSGARAEAIAAQAVAEMAHQQQLQRNRQQLVSSSDMDIDSRAKLIKQHNIYLDPSSVVSQKQSQQQPQPNQASVSQSPIEALSAASQADIPVDPQIESEFGSSVQREVQQQQVQQARQQARQVQQQQQQQPQQDQIPGQPQQPQQDQQQQVGSSLDKDTTQQQGVQTQQQGVQTQQQSQDDILHETLLQTTDSGDEDNTKPDAQPGLDYDDQQELVAAAAAAVSVVVSQDNLHSHDLVGVSVNADATDVTAPTTSEEVAAAVTAHDIEEIARVAEQVVDHVQIPESIITEEDLVSQLTGKDVVVEEPSSAEHPGADGNVPESGDGDLDVGNVGDNEARGHVSNDEEHDVLVQQQTGEVSTEVDVEAAAAAAAAAVAAVAAAGRGVDEDDDAHDLGHAGAGVEDDEGNVIIVPNNKPPGHGVDDNDIDL